jgi:3-dehydroquinate synthase
MPSLRLNLAERSYEITVSHGGLIRVAALIPPRVSPNLTIIITDEHVLPHAQVASNGLQANGWRTETIVLPAGEEQKSLTTAAKLYDRLAEIHADRRTLIVAVGGGVIGDVAGFVAATFKRGLQLFMVPTTLLAMVDSSVGGKVGINHPRAKNLIGAFYQPVGICIDPAVLATLPPREYASGLAEVVKYGVILDAEFFGWLERHAAAVLGREPSALEHVVLRCCRLKAAIVEQDEREENGLRAVLNYGHTFAHAFETVAGYGQWLHGEAVAAGMICASRLAQRQGLIAQEATERQRRLLQAFHLPTAPALWPVAELLAAMRSDKKALAGRLRFVLPTRLGEVRVVEVDERDVAAVLEKTMVAPPASG